MTTYAHLDGLLHHKTSRQPVPSRKIGNNTYAQRRGDRTIAVRLHNTDIATFSRLGEEWENRFVITLDSGGWLTTTTKDRMNTVLPPETRVDSRQGRWFVTHTWGQDAWYQDGFRIICDAGGRPADFDNVMHPRDRERYDRHNGQMCKLIDRYLKTMTEERHSAMTSYALDPVDSCSLCLWNDRTNKLIGDAMGDTQHLIEHLMERQLPRSVWFAACHERVGDRALYRIISRRCAQDDLRRYLRRRLYLHHTSSRRSVAA